MEEGLTAALAEAGKFLADAIGTALRVRGLPDALHVMAQDGRVVVGSSSRRVRDSEHGTADRAPAATVENAARRAAPLAAQMVAAALRRSLV